VFLLRLGRCHRGGFSSFSTVVEKMTNKEIADAAGVTEKTMRNYRQRRERIGISDSEPKIRVNKQGKRRPTKYKKRKPKKPSKAPSVLETYQPVCCWLQTDGKERGRLTACPRGPGGRPLRCAPPPCFSHRAAANAPAPFLLIPQKFRRQLVMVEG
jgi:hypothetical protein